MSKARTLGHELSGTVVQTGSGVEGWNVGDRVAVGADVPCGECAWCRRGLANACAQNLAIGYQFDGGFAEYILLDRRVVTHGPLVRVPQHVSMDTACLTEPLACCLNGYDQNDAVDERLCACGSERDHFGAGL